MEAGVWFHSSPTYNSGFTFMVLRRAFDENRTRVPRMIVKVRDATPELMRFEVEDRCCTISAFIPLFFRGSLL